MSNLSVVIIITGFSNLDVNLFLSLITRCDSYHESILIHSMYSTSIHFHIHHETVITQSFQTDFIVSDIIFQSSLSLFADIIDIFSLSESVLMSFFVCFIKSQIFDDA